MKSSRNHANVAANAGLLLVFLLAAAVLGLGAAIFPTGFMARLGIIAFGIISVILAWAFRSPRNGFPETFIFVGLLILSALSVLWPRYIYLHVSGLPSISLFTFATMAALYVVIIVLLYSPNFSTRIGYQISHARWFVTLVALWLGWRLLACILGPEPIYSLTGYARELIYLTSFLLFGFCIASIDNGPSWLVRIFVLCGLVTAVAGLIEGLSHHNIFSQFASAGDDADLAGNIASIALDKFRGGQYRAQATFNHPIVFAQYIAATFPIAVYSILQEKSKTWRFIAVLALPAGLAAIAQSASRAGIVGVAAAIALIGIVLWLRALRYGKFSKAIAIVAVPALIGAIGIGYFALEELTVGRSAQEAGSTMVRIDMLRRGIDSLQSSPLWGFGQGTALGKAGFFNSAGVLTLDNHFLNIAIDSGYIGLILMLAMLFVFFYQSVKYSISQGKAEGLFVGACAASVAALVITFTVLSIPNNMTMLWLLIAATFPFLGENHKNSETQMITLRHRRRHISAPTQTDVEINSASIL
jgi:hypothetical protein